MPSASLRPTWITRFPSVAALALGAASLAFAIVWKLTDRAPSSGDVFHSHNWIPTVIGVLTAQVGLLLAVSAALSAPRGSKWRAALPGLAASFAALAFWALIR
jgi:hypothetical protein